MTSTPDPRLQRLLGGPGLALIRRRLRHRFENAEPDAAPAPIRMDGLDIATHASLCQLTGRPSRPARSMPLDIADLDARLRAAGLADSLRHALELLEGPIVPKARLQRELQARWSALPTLTKAGPRLRAWLDTPPALTLLKRLGRDPERAAQLLAAADAVLCRLPAQGQAESKRLESGWRSTISAPVIRRSVICNSFRSIFSRSTDLSSTGSRVRSRKTRSRERSSTSRNASVGDDCRRRRKRRTGRDSA